MEEPTESVFQKKYAEFVEDLLGALPEYTADLQTSLSLDDATKLQRFQQEVKVQMKEDDFSTNPGMILPGVALADDVWATLTEGTKKAIWEHVRILSICSFMESGVSDSGEKPAWLDDAMNDDYDHLLDVILSNCEPTARPESMDFDFDDYDDYDNDVHFDEDYESWR